MADARSAAIPVPCLAIKIHEYSEVLGAGVSLSTNSFWFFLPSPGLDGREPLAC